MGEKKRKEKNIHLQEIENQANEQEKELSFLLSKAGISAELTPKIYSWKDIQQKLLPNEALVEFTRIRYFDKDFTDSVLYIALIVKKNSVYPEIVVFPKGNHLENRAISIYKNSLKIEDGYSYKNFFEPIANSIQQIKKIYLCNDGVFHQVNLSAIWNPNTQKYIKSEIEIQLVSTARDFVQLGNKAKLQPARQKEIYLFGHPDYAGEKKTNPVKENVDRHTFISDATIQNFDKKQRFLDISGEVVDLPGTLTEVENISKIAEKAQLKYQLYIHEKASEEELKKVSEPYILHIATHGFFLPNGEGINQNPLLRSGLLLANAEKTIKQKQYEFHKENGIFTSQEAMNIDLQGTELVVLSACETGLGDVQNGEGVFGLQRSLQEAGAKTIIMSLWTVDDYATQEMMSLFYENLLVKKQPKRLAFENAQEALKAKYVYPYYWAAFVMVGE